MSLVRAAGDVISDIITRIQSLNSEFLPTNYSVMKIVSIDPPGRQIANLWYLLDYLQKSQSIPGFISVLSDRAYRIGLQVALGYNPSTATYYSETDVLSMISVDVEEYAKNFLVYRKPAYRSSGTVLLINNSDAAITAVSGSIVRAIDGTRFVTTRDVTGETPVYMGYYDLQLSYTSTKASSYIGAYAIEVPAEAESAGVAYNVSAGTIVDYVGMTNVIRVYNPVDFTGGKDEESILALLTRLASAWQSRNIPTRGGYTRLYTDLSSVDDALVVMPSDTYAQREGAVDIYIQGRTLGADIMTLRYHGNTNRSIYLRKQPVYSITAVAGGATYTEGTDFDLVKDVEAYSGSYIARDKILFRSGHEPAAGEPLNIIYSYDALATTLQNILFEEDNYETVADVLIKLATRNLVEITAEISYLPGYEASAVNAAIETEILEYFTGDTAGSQTPKLLGDSVYQSDVIAIIEAVDGVDYVNVPLLHFYSRAEHESQVVDSISESTITVEDNEYLYLGTLALMAYSEA